MYIYFCRKVILYKKLLRLSFSFTFKRKVTLYASKQHFISSNLISKIISNVISKINDSLKSLNFISLNLSFIMICTNSVNAHAQKILKENGKCLKETILFIILNKADF